MCLLSRENTAEEDNREEQRWLLPVHRHVCSHSTETGGRSLSGSKHSHAGPGSTEASGDRKEQPMGEKTHRGGGGGGGVWS